MIPLPHAAASAGRIPAPPLPIALVLAVLGLAWAMMTFGPIRGIRRVLWSA